MGRVGQNRGPKAMRLTEEQARELRQSAGPVEVTDPTGDRVYVLLPVEVYGRVRELVESAGPAPPPAEAKAEVKPLRQRLRDLPVPAEVAERARERCRELGIWWAYQKQWILDRLLLQWHYGGRYVKYLPTEEGPVILAAGDLDETFDRQLAFVSPEDRRAALLDYIDPWDDNVTYIPSLGLNEDPPSACPTKD
jgi:hypothetical protein